MMYFGDKCTEKGNENNLYEIFHDGFIANRKSFENWE